MARAKTVFLDLQEMDLIHAQSIKSLQEIGIKVLSKPVLEILEKNGAKVDYIFFIVISEAYLKVKSKIDSKGYF